MYIYYVHIYLDVVSIVADYAYKYQKLHNKITPTHLLCVFVFLFEKNVKIMDYFDSSDSGAIDHIKEKHSIGQTFLSCLIGLDCQSLIMRRKHHRVLKTTFMRHINYIRKGLRAKYIFFLISSKNLNKIITNTMVEEKPEYG